MFHTLLVFVHSLLLSLRLGFFGLLVFGWVRFGVACFALEVPSNIAARCADGCTFSALPALPPPFRPCQGNLVREPEVLFFVLLLFSLFLV